MKALNYPELRLIPEVTEPQGHVWLTFVVPGLLAGAGTLVELGDGMFNE